MKTPDAHPDTPDDAWDDLFRQRLGDYATPPPADALNRILAGANPSRPSAYGRWLPVSLAVLLLIGIGGWLFVRKANRVLQPVAEAGRQTKLTTRPQQPVPVPTVLNAAPAGHRSAGAQAIEQAEEQAFSDRDKTPVEPVPQPVVRRLPLPALLPDRGANRAVTHNKEKTTKDRLADVSASSINNLPATNRLSIVKERLIAEKTGPVVRSKIRTGGPGAGPPSGSELTPDADWRQSGGSRAIARAAEPTAASRQRELSFSPAGRYESTTPGLSAQAEHRLPAIDALAGQPFRTFGLTPQLPSVAALTEPTTIPQVSRLSHRPSWFVSLTPLYNYQQIDPIHTDAELVSDIRVARPLATDRLGGRLQVGTEWQLADRLRMRTSLVYQQVRQSLRYAVQSTQPDSVQIVVIDNQSVQATPVFTRRSYAETAIWHYAGISADLVWQLNRKQSSPWQHYLTAGATVGRYVSRGGAVNGFLQVAYGIERPLTAGLQLRLEPTVQLGWQALTDETKRLQSRPYGYGLALGLRFR